MFEKHSEYFRDALVRNNCQLKWQTSYFLDCFTENLLLGGKHDLEEMDINIQSEIEEQEQEQNNTLEDGWDLEV